MKRWTKCFIKLFVIGNAGFLFSCAAIQQQQNESRDTASFNRHGLVYMKGDSHAQGPSFSKAPKMNSLLAAAFNNRGMISLEEGDYDQAILDLDKALEVDPANTVAYFNRALAYFLKGEYARFKSDAVKAQQSIKCSSSP
jgi:lipoprotein NlpI